MNAQIKVDQINSHISVVSLNPEEILPLIENFELEIPRDKLIQLIILFKDRSKTISEINMHLRSITTIPKTYNSEYLDEVVNDNTAYHLEMLVKKIEALPNELHANELYIWNEESVTELIKTYSKEFNIKIPYVAHIIRLSLIGKSEGPGMYKMLSILDREDVIKRLKKFRSYIL